MKNYDEIEKIVSQYPLQQFWFDETKLKNELQRLKSFRSTIIREISITDPKQGWLNHAKNLLNDDMSVEIENRYPSYSHPRLVIFDNNREIIEFTHPQSDRVSFVSAYELSNVPEDEFFTKYIQIIAKKYLKNLQDCICKSLRKNQKTICFITRRCFFVVKKIAYELRKKGHFCILITIEDLINPDDYKDSFDIILGGLDSYLFVNIALNSIDIDICYVQCMMWDYGLAKIVSSHSKTKKLVCEFYDITGLYANADKLKLLWPDELVEADLYYENFIFNEANLILSRFNSSIINEYRGQLVDKHAEIQPTTSKTKSPEEPSDDEISSPPRLVYLGNIIPRNENHPRSLFPLWGMPEAWQSLLEQGLEIHVYNSPFRKLNEPGMEPIIELSKNFENLKFHEGLPHKDIINEITKYDFGIILTVVDLDKNENSELLWRGAMGTKLLTYLEGGLPVIINKEFVAMSSLVERNQLGFSVASDEINQIAKQISGIDYQEVRANVTKFNDKNTFEQFNREALIKVEALLR